MAAHYYQLSADQGDAGGQLNYGICLEHGSGVARDLEMAAHYYRLSANQGDLFAQCICAVWLHSGQGVAVDLKMRIHYYKLAADHEDSEIEQFYKFRRFPIELQGNSTIETIHRNSSAAHVHATARLNIAHLLEEGIGIEADHILATRYYEMASKFFPSACAYHGWCLQNGRGVPINFTGAAESYQMAADCGNADGANSLAICLDKGLGVEKDLQRSLRYYQNAASQRHRSGMNNFGRCLEYGQGIEAHPIRAAQYYRLSAELKNADGANNFGICLEKGIGVRANIDLAVEYYRQAANEGHADGLNNLGFCLEYGRGVKQNIPLAIEYYRKAADLGHSEANSNYQRHLRLLGQWTVPDRSSSVSEQKPMLQEEPIIQKDCFETALETFANTKGSVESIDDWCHGGQIGKGELAVVNLVRDPKCVSKRAVKTQHTKVNDGYLERERAIHEKLNHPLIVGFEKYIPATKQRSAAILTEFVPNGTLEDRLPELQNFSNETRIAIIVAGIVLAMRYLHSQLVIHRDLKPANVLIDWDWIIRIGDFNHSLFADGFGQAIEEELSTLTLMHPRDLRYSAPECFENSPNLKSDVFSFGLILCELLTGNPPFPPDSNPNFVMRRIAVDGFRPDIPDFIAPNVKSIIVDCLKQKPHKRPSFRQILSRLKTIEFKITSGVNSAKVQKFVTAVKQREKVLGL
jgi:TPR repeat protein